jgi:hypothetical protein
VESKGRHAEYGESRDDVERHFFNRCRAAADAYGWNVTEAYDQVEAIYVTSGRFTDDATAYISANKISHGIECSVMDRAALVTFLRDAGQSRLIEIIQKYY